MLSLDPLHVLKKGEVEPGKIPDTGQQPVGGITFPGAADLAFAQPANGELQILAEVEPSVSVEPSPVAVVGIIRRPVVLEPIDQGVVVHVHPEEELGWIDVVTQERLQVIGPVVLVLVVIGDEVVVLVEAGEDRDVLRCRSLPTPVGRRILIVVVGDKFEQMAFLVLVVDETGRIGNKGRGAVVRIHTEGFAVGEPRVVPVGGGQVGGVGGLLLGVQFREILVGEPAVTSIHRVFAAHIEAAKVEDLEVHPQHLVTGRKSVVEADEPVIRTIDDLVPRLGHQQEYLIAKAIGLHVRSDLDAIVVGNYQFEGQLLDIAGGRCLVGSDVVVSDVVDQADDVLTSGFDRATFADATPYQRSDRRLGDAVDDDLVEKYQRPGFS